MSSTTYDKKDICAKPCETSKCEVCTSGGTCGRPCAFRKRKQFNKQGRTQKEEKRKQNIAKGQKPKDHDHRCASHLSSDFNCDCGTTDFVEETSVEYDSPKELNSHNPNPNPRGILDDVLDSLPKPAPFPSSRYPGLGYYSTDDSSSSSSGSQKTGNNDSTKKGRGNPKSKARKSSGPKAFERASPLEVPSSEKGSSSSQDETVVFEFSSDQTNSTVDTTYEESPSSGYSSATPEGDGHLAELKKKGKELLSLQKQLEESSRVNSSLEEQVKKMGSEHLSLQQQLEELSRVNSSLEEQTKKMGSEHLSLQQQLGELSRVNASLEAQAKKMGSEHLSLQQQLDEFSGQSEIKEASLRSELEEHYSGLIRSLHGQVESLTQRLDSAELKQKSSQEIITDLNIKINEANSNSVLANSLQTQKFHEELELKLQEQKDSLSTSAEQDLKERLRLAEDEWNKQIDLLEQKQTSMSAAERQRREEEEDRLFTKIQELQASLELSQNENNNLSQDSKGLTEQTVAATKKLQEAFKECNLLKLEMERAVNEKSEMAQKLQDLKDASQIKFENSRREFTLELEALRDEKRKLYDDFRQSQADLKRSQERLEDQERRREEIAENQRFVLENQQRSFAEQSKNLEISLQWKHEQSIELQNRSILLQEQLQTAREQRSLDLAVTQKAMTGCQVTVSQVVFVGGIRHLNDGAEVTVMINETLNSAITKTKDEILSSAINKSVTHGYSTGVNVGFCGMGASAGMSNGSSESWSEGISEHLVKNFMDNVHKTQTVTERYTVTSCNGYKVGRIPNGAASIYLSWNQINTLVESGTELFVLNGRCYEFPVGARTAGQSYINSIRSGSSNLQLPWSNETDLLIDLKDACHVSNKLYNASIEEARGLLKTFNDDYERERNQLQELKSSLSQVSSNLQQKSIAYEAQINEQMAMVKTKDNIITDIKRTYENDVNDLKQQKDKIILELAQLNDDRMSLSSKISDLTDQATNEQNDLRQRLDHYKSLARDLIIFSSYQNNNNESWETVTVRIDWIFRDYQPSTYGSHYYFGKTFNLVADNWASCRLESCNTELVQVRKELDLLSDLFTKVVGVCRYQRELSDNFQEVVHHAKWIRETYYGEHYDNIWEFARSYWLVHPKEDRNYLYTELTQVKTRLEESRSKVNDLTNLKARYDLMIGYAVAEITKGLPHIHWAQYHLVHTSSWDYWHECMKKAAKEPYRLVSDFYQPHWRHHNKDLYESIYAHNFFHCVQLLNARRY